MFNATVSNIIVEKTTVLMQTHGHTCVSLFQRLDSIIIIAKVYTGIFDLIKLILKTDHTEEEFEDTKG